ncbi:hypothetical protein [Streptomyces sp. 16-176A]|uniref:hypothetical protein n=1 Tax=Streptomyces sp. 16-176A TaxID=2530458 RepID=UPI00345D4B0B
MTKLKVTRVLAGALSAPSVTVQQLGTADVESPDTSRLMETGHGYLLYLSENDGREDPDHYVITGGDGIYVRRGDRYAYQGGPPAGPAKPLPRSLPADGLKERVLSGTTSGTSGAADSPLPGSTPPTPKASAS